METFNELRAKYIEKNPNSLFEKMPIEEKIFSKQEFIDQLKMFEIDITPRTISYYISEKIISNPRIGAKKIGRGKESYFSCDDIVKIRSFKALQKKGSTIKQIKETWALANEMRCLAFLKSSDNVFLERFKNLSTIFIDNLPEDIAKESFINYTGIKNPQRVDICVEIGKQYSPLKEITIKALEQTSILNPEGIYNSVLSLAWGLKLEKIYYEHDFSETSERALFSTLYTSTTLTLLLLSRTTLMAKVLDAILTPSVDLISKELKAEATQKLLNVSLFSVNAISKLGNIEK